MAWHDGTVTDRIVDLTLRAQRGPLPCRKVLAQEYGCHRRTIARALVAIERRIPVTVADEVQDYGAARRKGWQTRRLSLGLARGGM